jgi:hypothetical protein
VVAGAVVVGFTAVVAAGVVVVGFTAVVVAAEVVVAGVVLLQATKAIIATSIIANIKNRPFFTDSPPLLLFKCVLTERIVAKDNLLLIRLEFTTSSI